MNAKLLTALLLLLLIGGSVSAQDKQWLIFKDKGPEAATWMAQPERFLSERALARRERVGIGIESADLPLSTSYIASLQAAGIRIEGKSRWLNAVSARTALSLPELQGICPAIVAVRPVAQLRTSYQSAAPAQPAAQEFPPLLPPWVFDYGATLDQLDLINLPCLHGRGFTGEGVLLAQFDSGFLDVDSIAAFDSLRNSGRLVTWYDFVNQDSTVFDEDWHGLAVLSTIAAYQPGVYVGAAPHVQIALARTETVFSETHQEEDNWMMAAEWADSLGADVIQSSLGYYVFDGGQGDYTYASMDGNTTIITKAADMAAARGILVSNSAGNEGGGVWHYLIAPCDGDSVMCVGGVDINNTIAGFSSVGPSFDGRVKPDVVAVGANTAVVAFGGNVMNFNGTSFSAPQMAGFAACLIQAHPQRSNMEIIEAIRQSADRYANPDTAYGYGLPDACKADSILTVMDSLALHVGDVRSFGEGIQIFPNPSSGNLIVELPSSKYPVQRFRVTNMEGKILQEIPAKEGRLRQELDVQHLPSGTYLLESHLQGGSVSARKFIRK